MKRSSPSQIHISLWSRAAAWYSRFAQTREWQHRRYCKWQWGRTAKVSLRLGDTQYLSAVSLLPNICWWRGDKHNCRMIVYKTFRLMVFTLQQHFGSNLLAFVQQSDTSSNRVQKGHTICHRPDMVIRIYIFSVLNSSILYTEINNTCWILNVVITYLQVRFTALRQCCLVHKGKRPGDTQCYSLNSIYPNTKSTCNTSLKFYKPTYKNFEYNNN